MFLKSEIPILITLILFSLTLYISIRSFFVFIDGHIMISAFINDFFLGKEFLL